MASALYNDTIPRLPSITFNTPVLKKTEFQFGSLRPKTAKHCTFKNRIKHPFQRCKSDPYGYQYKTICYKMERFPRLQYNHKQVYSLEKRLKLFPSDIANLPPEKSTTIHLHVAGDISRSTKRLIATSTDDDKFELTDKRRWPMSALIYFQSEDEPLDLVEEIIESFYPVSWSEIFIVKPKYTALSENFDTSKYRLLERGKKIVREAITSFLETPLRRYIQKHLEKLRHDHKHKVTTELSNLMKDCRALSLLLMPEEAPTCEIKTPDSIKDFLFRRPGIYGFGLWKAPESEFRVFVNNDTDTERLKSELRKQSADFFNKISLSVVKSDMKVEKYTKQGEKLFFDADEGSYATTGALMKNDLDSDNIYGITCNHALTREEQQVFAKPPNTSQPLRIGECVYSNNEPNHDFAVYRVDDDKRRLCDTTFLNAMNNPCNVNIQERQIPAEAVVHKKGASTDWTTGRIESPEFYLSLFGGQSNSLFLVSSAEIDGRSFSSEGDSGSVVFLHDNSPSQNSVSVLGLVTGKINEVRVESLSEAQHCTVCLRLNTALSCLSERTQLDLRFDSSSRESSSSDEAD